MSQIAGFLFFCVVKLILWPRSQEMPKYDLAVVVSKCCYIFFIYFFFVKQIYNYLIFQR